MIYGAAIALLTLIIDLWTDVKRWYDERKVDHVRGALLRLIGLVPACILAKWFSPVLLFGYWVLFDGFYNILTGQNWFRRGETAKLDKVPVWVKYLGLALSIIVYIL